MKENLGKKNLKHKRNAMAEMKNSEGNVDPYYVRAREERLAKIKEARLDPELRHHPKKKRRVI